MIEVMKSFFPWEIETAGRLLRFPVNDGAEKCPFYNQLLAAAHQRSNCASYSIASPGEPSGRYFEVEDLPRSSG
jgi:hypothetical protein